MTQHTTRQQRLAIRQAELIELENQMIACKRNIESERKRHRELGRLHDLKLWCIDPNFDSEDYLI